MNRRWIAGLVGVGATFLMFSTTAEPPVRAGEELPGLPRVHVLHEDVTIPFTPRPKPIRVPPPEPRLQRAVQSTEPATRRTLLTRTARAFVGDGRYRPEPFPRPGRR